MQAMRCACGASRRSALPKYWSIWTPELWNTEFSAGLTLESRFWDSAHRLWEMSSDPLTSKRQNALYAGRASVELTYWTFHLTTDARERRNGLGKPSMACDKKWFW